MITTNTELLRTPINAANTFLSSSTWPTFSSFRSASAVASTFFRAPPARCRARGSHKGVTERLAKYKQISFRCIAHDAWRNFPGKRRYVTHSVSFLILHSICLISVPVGNESGT